MAAYMVENNQTCATFIKPIATNPEQTQFVCESYDFTGQDGLANTQFFVNATWYGDYYKAEFMNKTGLNEA